MPGACALLGPRRSPSVRARLLLVALTVVPAAASCRTYDPDVFDERLRAATVDAYVEAIETQFGGLEVAGLSEGDLRERYRDAAIEAPTPAVFYAVLRAMLADLDDPHATLRVSSRFWSGPVAEPELVRFVRSRGEVWMGAPPTSLRTEEELDVALDAWLDVLGAIELDDLDQRGTAELLRMSAASNEFRSPWAAAEPLVWLRVRTIDGVEIETPHDGELMARGDLGTRARIVVDTIRGPLELALLRNAGVFEDDPEQGVRRRLGPLELAALLDPDTARRRGAGSRRPLRLQLRDPLQRPFRTGTRLELPAKAARAFGADAWMLRTPQGVPVGYLRIGSFRPRDTKEPSAPAPSLDEVLERVFEEFAPVDDLVIDLTGNPGGSWQETGLFVSYFLEPEEGVVPHEVVSVAETRHLFLLRVRTIETQTLARANVPFVLPRRIHVLVDQDTASAGEIAASALRGLADAVLVGERTAGAEFSTAEFVAPDGSILTIGLGGGMRPPLESFQGIGLEPDLEIVPNISKDESLDLERWRASFRFQALGAALERIDRTARGAISP
ncbi:MAG: S41 family peptidase [Planctomycetota bacterium]